MSESSSSTLARPIASALSRARASIVVVMSTPMARPAGADHLRGSQQVRPGGAAEVYDRHAGVDVAQRERVGDAGEALDGLVGSA
jgi:hypothetical protein